MKKTQNKNIVFLKKIIKEISEHPTVSDAIKEKTYEADEFAEEVENDISDLNDSVVSLKNENSSLKSQLSELQEEQELENTEHLGVDTLYWKLESGNILVTDEIEQLIYKLKKQYGMIPA